MNNGDTDIDVHFFCAAERRGINFNASPIGSWVQFRSQYAPEV